MTCLRMPVSLDDATAIIECAGGPDWRTPFTDGRMTPDELADALICLADRSDIDTTWTDPKAPESWFSEHGKPRPAR